MNWFQKSGLILSVAVALAVGVVVGMNMNSPAVAQGGKGAIAGSRYSVIETEGVNLIVTDNASNTVYFYTVDDSEKPGADLHLRGTIDLSKVGEATIRPTLINPKK